MDNVAYIAARRLAAFDTIHKMLVHRQNSLVCRLIVWIRAGEFPSWNDARVLSILANLDLPGHVHHVAADTPPVKL